MLLNSSNYKILNIDNGIELYYIENGMLFQERFFRLLNSNTDKVVYEISRDQIKKVGSFSDDAVAYSVLIILFYKSFELVQENNEQKRKLRKADSVQSACNIISQNCDEKFYSIFTYKDNAICLIKNNELYNVFYKCTDETVEIATDVNLGRAFVITMNYANLLRNFNSIFEKLSLKTALNNDDYYCLLKLYLF